MNNKFTMLSRTKWLFNYRWWGVWFEFTTYNWKFIPTIELSLYASYLSLQFLCFGIKIIKIR